MRILIDLTRLISRSHSPVPTGIDRVEFAYADHYLRQGTADATAITPVGTLMAPRRQAARLISDLEERWEGGGDGSDHPAFQAVLSWLSGNGFGPQTGVPAPTSVPPPSMSKQVRSHVALGFRRPVTPPRDAIYLHVSHSQLDQPRHFAWLDRRPDVRAVFLLHDLIPLEYPEHCRPIQVKRHKVRLETMSRRASAIVVTSNDVARRTADYLEGQRLRVPPLVVSPLGLDIAFKAADPAMGATRPYFVVCGTIESRKNHLLLLQIWRDFALRFGAAAPALLVIGSRGWGGEAVVDFMSRCEMLQPHVREVPGLPTSSVRRLIAGARALLMPSFAEGYGLPIIEALSLGTRVVASDLASHREVAKGSATLLDPLDGRAWKEAILIASDQKQQMSGLPYRAPTWSDHFVAVDACLAGIASRPGDARPVS